MHGFYFNNIIADNSEGDKNSAIFITGTPNQRIEDVSIKDVRFIVSGGGTTEDAAKVDSVKEYTQEVMGPHSPEFYSIGTLPAFGVYARHIDDLHLENINIHILSSDERPAVIVDDVTKFYNDIIKVNSEVINNKEILKTSSN
ncbi:MAG: hypothetical protein JEZ01_05615 [Labilibaculum sp.]|nr:hypothetical protein [Labilibaculum sp.]MBI9057230.1 hypothetical protein [Labilibaculum sp.]